MRSSYRRLAGGRHLQQKAIIASRLAKQSSGYAHPASVGAALAAPQTRLAMTGVYGSR